MGGGRTFEQNSGSIKNNRNEMGKGLIPVRSKTVMLGNLASDGGGVLGWTNLPTDNNDK